MNAPLELGPGAMGLDAPVFVFWNEDGILASFSLRPGARLEPEEGARRFAGVAAEVVCYKAEDRADVLHPAPVYMPPPLVDAFLLLLRVTIGGEWEAKETTRRKLTENAHAWAAAQDRERANRRTN